MANGSAGTVPRPGRWHTAHPTKPGSADAENTLSSAVPVGGKLLVRNLVCPSPGRTLRRSETRSTAEWSCHSRRPGWPPKHRRSIASRWPCSRLPACAVSLAPSIARSTACPAQCLERDLQRKQERSEEHTSELQSPCNLVCRLLLEKKK